MTAACSSGCRGAGWAVTAGAWPGCSQPAWKGIFELQAGQPGVRAPARPAPRYSWLACQTGHFKATQRIWVLKGMSGSLCLPSEPECVGKRLGAVAASPAGRAGEATTACLSTSSPFPSAALALPCPGLVSSLLSPAKTSQESPLGCCNLSSAGGSGQ